MEDNDDKGYGTINIDKVLQVLKGAQEGMRMAFPNYQGPIANKDDPTFPLSNPPTHEPGDIRGVLHFNAGEYNPTAGVKEHGHVTFIEPKGVLDAPPPVPTKLL